jgi:hypothetical protein
MKTGLGCTRKMRANMISEWRIRERERRQTKHLAKISKKEKRCWLVDSLIPFL